MSTLVVIAVLFLTLFGATLLAMLIAAVGIDRIASYFRQLPHAPVVALETQTPATSTLSVAAWAFEDDAPPSTRPHPTAA